MPEALNLMDALMKNAKVNAAILLDSNGIILEVNNAFTSHFGYTHSDIAGQHFSVLFTTDDRKKGFPGRELRKTLAEGHSSDNNYLLNEDLTTTWVSGESLLIRQNDGNVCIIKIIQDIHEQKVGELGLANLNDLNENILGSIEDVVIVLDDNMMVTKANNAFKKLFKKSPANLSNFNFETLIKPYDKTNKLLDNIKNVLLTKTHF